MLFAYIIYFYQIKFMQIMCGVMMRAMTSTRFVSMLKKIIKMNIVDSFTTPTCKYITHTRIYIEKKEPYMWKPIWRQFLTHHFCMCLCVHVYEYMWIKYNYIEIIVDLFICNIYFTCLYCTTRKCFHTHALQSCAAMR